MFWDFAATAAPHLDTQYTIFGRDKSHSIVDDFIMNKERCLIVSVNALHVAMACGRSTAPGHAVHHVVVVCFNSSCLGVSLVE